MATTRVGIGGWDYAPWRATFYPDTIPQKRQLEYASRQFSSIEINSTFYRNARPEHYASWHAQTPDDFLFAVKANRYTTHRKELGEAGESVERFLGSGLSELGDKLGPILWQLAATKHYDPDDLAAFFKLLPARLGKRRLRHVLDARHDSFLCAGYLQLARRHHVATVFTDAPQFPAFADITGDLIYARLMNARSTIATGYTRPALKKWAAAAQQWQAGQLPELPGRPYVTSGKVSARERDVFVYFINGAKERAPAAATRLIDLLQ
ncbi:DUF72 domain-containing protein [Duganella sp. LX20W]|uniref:DUF72 domain-containing protein n=1 Tax=Rugamonas brunnea TaxID=2758569 RepID=A0A7W2EW92_9BURK|nr:DUF72 domain-containing protein [Rugamonas brunnea]MBA5639730.1 DUF72 domain-containing protein [Rugamonas brunnea]